MKKIKDYYCGGCNLDMQGFKVYKKGSSYRASYICDCKLEYHSMGESFIDALKNLLEILEVKE